MDGPLALVSPGLHVLNKLRRMSGKCSRTLLAGISVDFAFIISQADSQQYSFFFLNGIQFWQLWSSF
jgi:hypothetical protein